MKGGEVPREKRASARWAARLAAVQALYQVDQSDPASMESVVDEFIEYRLKGDSGAGVPVGADKVLFAQLLHGVMDRRGEVDTVIAGCLANGRCVDKLQVLLRAVLRAGTYELMALTKVPAPVVINEYVEIAHAFFDRGEPRLVNGVLDHVARRLRVDEFPGSKVATAEEPG